MIIIVHSARYSYGSKLLDSEKELSVLVVFVQGPAEVPDDFAKQL